MLVLGAHLNIIVQGPFKLVGKNYIVGVRAPWINIIVRGPFKLGPFKHYYMGLIEIGW